MEIRYATISKTGRRHNNEDAYKVIDMPQNNRFMGIVCDGQYQTSDKSNYRLVTEFFFVRMDYTKAWLLTFCKQG